MPKNSNGFSLIELMITISILGIILAIAAPSFSQQIESSRTRTAIENIASDFANAQSEAIKKNQRIFFKTYISGSDWCYGYGESNSAFTNCNCNPTSGKSCNLKLVKNTMYKNIKVNIEDAFEDIIGFEPIRGQLIDSTGASLTKKSIRIENKNGMTGYITISTIGKISMCSSSDADKSIAGLPKTSGTNC